MAGAAGIMAFSPSLISSAISAQQKDIISRSLGKTGMKVPVISFGVMRADMYAYGYSNPAMAYSLLSELGTNNNPCSECGSCQVKCTRDFNIREKIADISRLVDVPKDFLA